MEQQQAIIGLKSEGLSDRRIARELGLNQRTVRCYAEAKCTNSQTGKKGRTSKCEEHREWIRKNHEAGLSVERLHQDLLREHGFEGSYHSVFRFVQQLVVDQAKPVCRMECEPAQEAQVDYFTACLLLAPSGRLRKAHFLLVTLSHSRKSYVEATMRQTTEMARKGVYLVDATLLEADPMDKYPLKSSHPNICPRKMTPLKRPPLLPRKSRILRGTTGHDTHRDHYLHGNNCHRCLDQT